jgi:nucleoside-diphosphate-sugar epimerase
METQVVTGAFGYTGKYITQRLLNKNITVKTLTNSIHRKNDFGNKVMVSPFFFDEPDKLKAALEGASVLYNTYWVRFNHRTFQHSEAVENTLKLFEAAKQAGVKRIVHTSIIKPDKNSKLEYYSGKGILEEALINSGISYAILRPGVIFGLEDILINNIAWMIRKFPIFGVFGDGKYRLQPIFVEDFADLAVEYAEKTDNVIIDANGPETFTYRELVKTISKIILGKERKVFSMPDEIGYWVSKLVGSIKGDNLITREEIKGLKADLLYSDSIPTGKTKLTDWLIANKNTVGKVYSNELKRRLDRTIAYK